MNADDDRTPLLSIVVPVYNTAPYLAECLDSLCNQTLRDIEIVCVNDGSTDGSLEILRKYEKRDKRVRVIDQKNQGVSVARNNGIESASGKYLFFMDSDDSADLTLGEQVTTFAEKYQFELVNIRTKTECLTKKYVPYVRKLVSSIQTEQVYDCHNISDQQRELFIYIVGGPYHTIVRRDFWNKCYIKFPTGVRVNEDYCVFFKLYAVAQKVGFLFPASSLYHYRIRQDSVSHTAYVADENVKSKIWDMFTVFKDVKQYYVENGLFPSYRSLVIKYLLDFEVMYLNIPRRLQTDFRNELTKCWDDTFEEVINDTRYLPFTRRYFWFWYYGKKLRKKITGSFIMFTRYAKRRILSHL